MKKLNKILIGISFITLFYSSTRAQVYRNITESSDKMTIKTKSSSSDISSGSPYLFDDWEQGKVTFKDGSAPQEKQIKYNILEKELIIRGEDGKEYTYTSPVASFSLQINDNWLNFLSGFHSKKLGPETFVQVIYHSNKVSCYKSEEKDIIESKSYNSPAVTKKIETTTHYYFRIGTDPQALREVKRDQKSILAMLGKPELANYIKTNKLNLKKDTDLAKLLAYYDTL